MDGHTPYMENWKPIVKIVFQIGEPKKSYLNHILVFSSSTLLLTQRFCNGSSNPHWSVLTLFTYLDSALKAVISKLRFTWERLILKMHIAYWTMDRNPRITESETLEMIPGQLNFQNVLSSSQCLSIIATIGTNKSLPFCKHLKKMIIPIALHIIRMSVVWPWPFSELHTYLFHCLLVISTWHLHLHLLLRKLWFWFHSHHS